MSKTVKVISAALIPGSIAGEMKSVHPGSVLKLDDEVAGALVAGQRAIYVDDDTKTVDTTKTAEAEADKRTAAVASPEAAMAAAVAVAVKEALQAAVSGESGKGGASTAQA
jgi:hypothetical protein